MPGSSAPRTPGRPRLLADVVVYKVKMTPEQRAKLDRLGGAAWIRDRIERAREKPVTPPGEG